MSRKNRKKKAKSKKKIRVRSKTIQAAFRREVNTSEKVIPNRKIYSRKKEKNTFKKIKGNITKDDI